MLLLGAESGNIYIVSLADGSCKSFRAHDRSINDISTDSNCQTIASCSDNGTVILYTPSSEENKERLVHFNEPVKSICVEEEFNPKRERSFVAGITVNIPAEV